MARSDIPLLRDAARPVVLYSLVMNLLSEIFKHSLQITQYTHTDIIQCVMQVVFTSEEKVDRLEVGGEGACMPEGDFYGCLWRGAAVWMHLRQEFF